VVNHPELPWLAHARVKEAAAIRGQPWWYVASATKRAHNERVLRRAVTLQNNLWLARAGGLLMLMASVLSLGCNDDSYECAPVGAVNSAKLEFSPPVVNVGSIELVSDELHCRFVMPVDTSAGGTDASAGAGRAVPTQLVNVPECDEVSSSDSDYSVSLFAENHSTWTVTSLEIRFNSDLISELTYRFYRDTELRHERTVQFSYQPREQGPGCPRSYTATVETPP